MTGIKIESGLEKKSPESEPRADIDASVAQTKLDRTQSGRRLHEVNRARDILITWNNVDSIAAIDHRAITNGEERVVLRSSDHVSGLEWSADLTDKECARTRELTAVAANAAMLRVGVTSVFG